MACFNPRAREGRDTAYAFFSARFFLFQSTRPRGARLLLLLCADHDFSVSIHAPARGATNLTPPARPQAAFQSTRPRGARRQAGFLAQSRQCFNPRAREGRDRRGFTRRTLRESFNPRAREGRDLRGS